MSAFETRPPPTTVGNGKETDSTARDGTIPERVREKFRYTHHPPI